MLRDRIIKDIYDGDNEIEAPDQPIKPQIPNPKANDKPQNQSNDSCGCGTDHGGSYKSKKS